METRRSLPNPLPPESVDPIERELIELEAAIEIVERGVARNVSVTGLHELEAIAGAALVAAQQAGVRFAVERDEASGALTARIGPRTLTLS